MTAHRTHRFRHLGLRVVYEHVPGPLTAIALAVRAGARFDGRYPGIAHMAEHMLFQGTATLDQLALNRRAAELGGEHNADTGHEDIAMTFEVFNEDLGAALGLLADQFYHTRVDPTRLRKERRVVEDEIRGRADDPIDVVHTRLWNAFFRGALAHPVFGSVHSLRRMTAASVTGFIRRHFVHGGSVLGIVGGARLDHVRASVANHFSRRHESTPPRMPPVRRGRRGMMRVRRRDANQAYVARMIALPRTTRQLIATGIALELVGADPDSHLFQAIREQHGIGYDVAAHLEWGPDWALAVLAASGAPGSAARLRQVIDDTCARAAEAGFEADELARARKKLRYRYASLEQSRLDRALALAEGTLSGFPAPAAAQALVQRISAREIEAAWQSAVDAPSLTAVLDT